MEREIPMTQPVDLLMTNAVVLTMDEKLTQYEPGAVAILGNSLVAVGTEKDLLDQYLARETIDCQGKVLMPGLVNAHTHAAMTLLRGLADDLRLDVWLLGYMMPVEREFVSPEFVRLGTLLACAEMIRSGVTCFADMYYFESHVASATAQVGLRAVCAQTVYKFTAPDALDYEDALVKAREFIKEWKDHPLIVPAIGPHAFYTCTQEILQNSAKLALEYDVPLLIHISETSQEVETCRNDNGMPVVPYVKKQGIFEAKTLAAHCVHLDEGEINTLRHHNVGVAHNPSSNLKLASGFAPTTNMLEAKLNVGIGTDGAASNNDLDMFEEIRLAAFIAKAHTNDPTALHAHTALTMGTRLGAQALHLGNKIGSLEPGKCADLILIDLKTSHTAPRFRRDRDNIYAQIVYSAKSTDVSDVMVDGRWLMRDRVLLTVNETEIIEQTKEYARQIDTFLTQREQSILSKLIAIGGAEEAESYEVQVKVRVQNAQSVIDAIKQPSIEILHFRHYHEYDTYFAFTDPKQGQLRYREDEFIGEDDQVETVRYRLTLLGIAREERLPSDVLLSRSRFLAPATHSLRFYREYFKPASETVIHKDRLRWRILFHGTECYINLDEVNQPNLGFFVEIKSRTWSRRDAEHKSELAIDLLKTLGIVTDEIIGKDYLELI